eukprot:s2132_g14.t1
MFFLGVGYLGGHGAWVTYDQLQGEAPVVDQPAKAAPSLLQSRPDRARAGHKKNKKRYGQRHQALQATGHGLEIQQASNSRQIAGAESNSTDAGELGIASQLDETLLQKFGLNKSSFQAIVLRQQENGDPNIPPVEPSPSQLRAVTLSDRGFNILKKAYEFVRPFRARGEDMVASLLMVGDAENCLMKLAYSTYRMDRDGEDDYPYLPRKCGDDFRWDTGSVEVRGFVQRLVDICSDPVAVKENLLFVVDSIMRHAEKESETVAKKFERAIGPHLAKVSTYLLKKLVPVWKENAWFSREMNGVMKLLVSGLKEKKTDAKAHCRSRNSL